MKRPCTVKYFRRFGCVCYVLNTQLKTKFDNKSTKGFLIDCEEDSYYTIEPESGKVLRSKNVKFIESKIYKDFYKRKMKTCLDENMKMSDVTSQELMKALINQKMKTKFWLPFVITTMILTV